MQTNYNGNSSKSGIYQIRNITNEKFYIGKTTQRMEICEDALKTIYTYILF